MKRGDMISDEVISDKVSLFVVWWEGIGYSIWYRMLIEKMTCSFSDPNIVEAARLLCGSTGMLFLVVCHFLPLCNFYTNISYIAC